MTAMIKAFLVIFGVAFGATALAVFLGSLLARRMHDDAGELERRKEDL